MKFYINKKACLKLVLFLLLSVAVFILSSQSVHAMDLQSSPFNPDTDTKVKLDWSSVTGARIYQLYRNDGLSNVNVASIQVGVALNPLQYIDANLQPQTSYIYTIRAYGDTALTNLLDEKTSVAVTSNMIRPYNLQYVFNINTKTATLSWNASTLATSSILNLTQSGESTSISITGTTSEVIPFTGLSQVQFTVQSVRTGLPASSESDSITVIPIAPPTISAVSGGGTATISWPAFPQITDFQLERSTWGSTSWGSWVVANTALSGTSVTDTPAAIGQYRYRLNTKTGSVYTGVSNTAETASGLPAPSELVPTVINNGRINLSWANGPGNLANVQVLRMLSNGTYTQIALLPNTATTYSDYLALNSGTTYYYRVRAYESAANYSAAAEASVSASLPASPTPLHASVVSPTNIRLNWSDLSTNEDGFRIERMTDTGIFTEIASVPPNVVTYSDESVSTGYTYIYRICSYNVMGSSAYSNEVTINSWDTLAPASLAVTAVSSSRLDLTWSYSGTESYNTIIERKTGTGGSWTPIYTTALSTVKFSDTGLSANTRYFYRVKKSLGTGSSGIPYPNNDIGIGAYTFLGNVSISGEAAPGNKIYITWSGNNSSADIIIERKMPNGNFSALTTVGPSAIGWYDETGLVPSASYTYRIKARTTTNESLYSSELTVQNFYLDAPSGLGISVGTNSAITLKWTDNSMDETGFEIWRYIQNSGTYTLYATVDKNITTFTDQSIHTGVQYSYKVRAYVTSGSLYSPFSSTASVGVGLINPPANLHYTYVSSNQVLLQWTDTSDNESGFKVEWKMGVDGEWNINSWLNPNITACTISNLNPYTKYYFRIRAYSATGNADSVSNELLVSTALPAAPSEISAISLTASQIKITWKDNSDSEDGFKILRKSANAFNYSPLAEVGKNTVIFMDNSAQAGFRYFYKIVSYNATGSSESKEVEVRTNTRVYFTDLKNASWAKDAIENLAGLGIIKGITKTQFKPGNSMSKAQFTSIVVRSFKLDTAPIGSLADVYSNKWYYKEVMIAENFGIISGDANNRFYPEAAITREEIAMILFKALETSGEEFTVHDNSVLEKFSDKNNITPQAVSSMATLVGEGIFEGLPGNAIGPKHTATRAQAAVFMYRILNLVSK